MRRRLITFVVAALLLAVAVLFWRVGGQRRDDRAEVASQNVAPVNVARFVRPPATNETTVAESTSPVLANDQSKTNKNNPLAYRLTNTTKTNRQLRQDDHAVLLENASIDASQPVDFKLPDSLQASDEPGAYIVVARKTIGGAFRAAVAGAGAGYVSYLPVNAWLVQATAAQAQQLRGSAAVQAVLPWLPVYKLKTELLVLAMQGQPLPPEAKLNLLAYTDTRAAVLAQLGKLNATVLAEERSPFGSVITVQPAAGADWLALARMGGVQILERAYPRTSANDLSRVRIGVAPTATVATNYLGLTGTNVMVGINDSGVDATHPDFSAARIFGLTAANLTDTNGHGTHVAGIIAGNGAMSTNVINARGSSNPGTNVQFRGAAPGAALFVQNFNSAGTNVVSNATLQENSARTNVFISNNSWGYSGNSSYDLASASYDAAVRDSLPGVTGSQPVLYVFAAGNSGGGSDGGLSGNPDSVLSPATAKNVISVGAIELARDITNIVTKITGIGTTNQTTNTSTPWKAMTSSGNQVARFSSRGNVGIGVEGEFGRYKPDVVAPGTFVVSTRSSQWDEIAYYNPTNHHYTTLSDQIIGTNGLTQYGIFLPDNAVGFSIQLVRNSDSPTPFPNLPVYVRRDAPPTTFTFDVRRTNAVFVPPDLAGLGTAVGQSWAYAIGNPTNIEVSLDIITDVITTNDLGNYFQVLSNLNNSICSTNGEKGVPPNYYRYESGTSMAAPAVSGTLALMQEFFEQRLHTNSPALMKALLINGARSVGNLYDFQVQSAINYQGWGLIKLNNSLSAGIDTAFDHTSGSAGAVKIYDQSPTNALATAQSQTRSIKVDSAAGVLPLRVTLAWTDPPGNPAAGVKLVNDLDLIVTNLDTGDIYLGNDIPGSSIYTAPWDTNGPPNYDSVNNVENVFISPALGTNYTITVLARRVNVNAVTAHTNDVVQDYALVISCGSGEVTNAFAITNELALFGAVTPDVTHVTNTITEPDFVAAFLENQRVSANTPLLGTTNGMTNQWKFYVVTNSTGFTNAAFLLSQQTDLAVPRMGVFADYLGNATRTNADIDLYVSTDSELTNLSPPVLAAAFKSLTRNDISGDELIILSNAQPVYYVGVKSEDYQAAQYDFFAIFSLLPLGAEDANGFVRAYPMTGYDIPDGSPSRPGGTRFMAVPRPSLTGSAESVRRVVITNNVSHENYGDIISAVSHNSRAVVLDNHRSLTTPPYPAPPGPFSFIYDDSGQKDFPGVIPPDGPGTFETYMGEAPGGVWYFTYSDDALSQSGRVNDLRLRVDRQCEDNCDGVTNVLCGPGWMYFSRNVPLEATNLTVDIGIITASNPQSLDLYIRKGRRPTLTAYDFKKTINPPGGSLSIDKSLLPPLTAGRYFIGVYNPHDSCETFVYKSTVKLGPPPTPIPFNGFGNQPLLDDAATNYTIFVNEDKQIARLDVGLRIDHPRVSDLAVTLVSPRGTRVLLVENRGGTTTNGFGSSLTVTNFFPVNASGTALPQTNIIDTGSTMGTVTIDYNFYNAPDQMSVFYESSLIASVPETGGSGRLTVNYGPGTSTLLEIVMNLQRTNTTASQWDYTVSSYNTANSYLTFTDNTNLTTTPVKFALPPFVGIAGTNYQVSDFEPPVLATNYLGVTAGTPDNWSVINSNTVTVITNTAYTGNQSLALRSGQISRVLNTTPGRSYRLGYGYRKVPNSDGMISWWRAEDNALDSVDGNHGVFTNNTSYAPGMVGQAFIFDGNRDGVNVGSGTNLQLQDFTFECWVKRTSAVTLSFNGNGNGTLFAAGAAGGGYNFYIKPGGTLAFGKSQVSEVTSVAQVTGTNWHHVAFTKQGTIVIFYVDGVAFQASSAYSSGLFTFSAPAMLGAWLAPGGIVDNSLYGMIDEATVYGAVLTADRIKEIYLAGAAGKCGMTFPPSVCASALGAQAYVPGVVTNAFLGSTNWQAGGIVFNATGSNTTVLVSPLRSGNHIYRLIRTNITWANAQAVAATFTFAGMRGHLATITSAAENELIRTNLSSGLVNEFAWIGGSEPADDGIWRWTAGPEAGMQFSSNAVSTLPFYYANWGTNQPNDAVASEDYLMFNIGTTNSEGVRNGEWADGPPTPGAPNSIVGFIVEFEPDQSSGVLVDTFKLTELASPRYVLPEESLKAFEGENAYGLWQLEILDTRTGMTNNVKLVDWQLQFVYQTNTAAPRVLNPGNPVDVTLPPGQIIYFIVDVPSFARFATNILFNSDQNLGFYFNQNIPPSFGATNTLNGDVVFASPTRNWTEVLSTTNTVPPTSTKADLLPGQRYYLAVENLSAFNASFTVYVDFDLRTLPPFVDLTNGVPYCTFNPTPFSLDYYHFTVSSNAVRAQFEIDNPSGDMTLLLRRTLPPALGIFDYLSANPSTNDEFVTVFDFSQPVKLTPGDWYFAAVNLSAGPVTYCAGAWEWLTYGTNIVITNVFMGTNSFCLTWASLPGVRYYVEGLTNLNSTNWVTASPTITATGATTTYCVPLPSPLQFFRVREGQALSTFVPQPYITRIVKRFNGVEITWSGPPGQQYKVEWSPTLVPTVWTQFTETVTSITGIYQYLDDGSQTGGFGATRYYRLVLLP